MRRGILFVNLLLLLGVVLLADRLKTDWEIFEETSNLLSIVNGMLQQEEVAVPSAVASMEQPQSFPNFMVIWEKDLFREERRPEAESIAEAGEQADEKAPKWRARPLLHGVSEVGGKKQAIMTVYKKKSKSGQMRTVEIGDEVQGYTVAGIGDTVVRLSWQKREETIDMADTKPPQNSGGAGAKTAAVTVITVGAAPKAVQAAAKTTSQAEQEQQRGLQVAVVGGSSGQRGQGGPGQRAQSGRDRSGRQSGGRPGGGGLTGQGRGLSGSVSSGQNNRLGGNSRRTRRSR